MPRSSDPEGCTDREYEVVLAYAVAKGRRYGLPTVHISDRMVHGWVEWQKQILAMEVADQGFALRLGHHDYGGDFNTLIAQRTVPRFGADRWGQEADSGHS